MATFKSKMKHLDPNWADEIWLNAREMNDKKGAQWLPGIAALAVTGARPASLERGIVFEYVQNDQGKTFIQATIPGAKILKNSNGTPHRGQDETKMCWEIGSTQGLPPRTKELKYINELLIQNGNQPITLTHGANALSVAVRTLSKQIWPRRTRHVSPICYRELFSSNAKAAGVPADQLAMAMGHLSAESQGRYSARSRKAKGDGVTPRKVFSDVAATHKVKKMHRSPLNSMARFKAAQSLKTKLKAKMGPSP